MAYVPQPTTRSPNLLLSFPPEILLPIFDLFFSEELYNPSSVHTREELSCRVVSFGQVVRVTKGVRGACPSWAHTARSLVFRGKSTRHGYLVRIRRLFTESHVRTFPLLRDCIVKLCHPYSLLDVSAVQQELAKATYSLEYVCAVTWADDEIMTVMRGRVEGMGYGPFETDFVNTFVDECVAAGLKIADCQRKWPNGGGTGDSERLREAGLQAIEKFFFKELLALWYYNAQLVRQILGAFPNLGYAVFPSFLHVPLVAKMKYFFPQLEDNSPFAPVTLTPPQMLQTLGIKYTGGGRRYSDIMASLRVVEVSSYHYNAIRAVAHRMRFGWGGLMLLARFNCWVDDWYNCDLPWNIIHMIEEQVEKAVSDIPESRKPKRFPLKELALVMEEQID
ncbi:uncharacterized protein BJX67DRAFT_315178 [Aspergillus lucknowensis]|uniref:F-box domain-containing protein n=1 Tax=Aspergillus lucknowensis TaxID=176173 RepID=A0ABR4L983_9EURO